MKRDEPIEIFMPPNMLKAKAGGGTGGVDMAAVKRAQQAMETLQTEFADWLTEDVRVLVAARSRYAEAPHAEAHAALLRAAHDIKGQAATFHYPLIARVAGSLSKLIGDLPETATLPLSLIDAHVNAILVIHKQTMQDTADEIALALCRELEARVEEILAGAQTA
jgi:chemotaxis protein histidine kinase CheA